jgi:chemotaxis protein MotB
MSLPGAQPARRRVIKKVVGHGHHGGAWKIAYADFVTAMMALFLVLWLLASTDAKSREEIAQYFRTGILPDAEMSMGSGSQYVPSIIERSPQPTRPDEQSIIADAQKLQASIDEAMDNHTGLAELANKVRVRVTPDGVVIEIVDDSSELLFDTASARLKAPLEAFLAALGPMLASRKGGVEIQGHTDARPFVSGAGKTNWDLSYERASAARLILERHGVRPDRIVGVVGRASSDPIDEDPYAAQNRRLSLLLRREPAPVADEPPRPR